MPDTPLPCEQVDCPPSRPSGPFFACSPSEHKTLCFHTPRAESTCKKKKKRSLVTLMERQQRGSPEQTARPPTTSTHTHAIKAYYPPIDRSLTIITCPNSNQPVRLGESMPRPASLRSAYLRGNRKAAAKLPFQHETCSTARIAQCSRLLLQPIHHTTPHHSTISHREIRQKSICAHRATLTPSN